MNVPCYLHPVQLATATCAECARPICGQCAQTVANRSVCAPCVAAIRSRVSSQLDTQAVTITPAPRPAAIPLNGPYPDATAAQPLGGGQMPQAQPLYAPIQAPPLYPPPGSAVPPLYAQPLAPATVAPPLYGQQAPASVPLQPHGQPTTYGQNPAYGQQPYGRSGYGQPGTTSRPSTQSSAASGPNITLGIVVGILLVLGLGAAFGFASAAIGFRIPFQTIAIGYIVGYAIRAACGGTGQVQGMIAGVCSLLAASASLGIMYLGGAVFSPIAIFLLLIAVSQGYKIAAG